MPNEHDSDDGRNGGRGFDDLDDVSDATIVDGFPSELLTQYARRICAVAIDSGRHGTNLGDLALGIGLVRNPGERAEALTKAHAHGCNVARCLRDALELATLANELVGKAAARARFEKEISE